jgi:hypothetical protein
MDEQAKVDGQSKVQRLSELRRERDRMQRELARLDLKIDSLEAVGQTEISTDALPGGAAPPETPEEKVALFLNFFGTRRSVYPKYWANTKTGKKGYAPVCDNEWRPGVCQKPRVKCAECRHQRFPALDAQAIEAHLRGQHTLGVYRCVHW